MFLGGGDHAAQGVVADSPPGAQPAALAARVGGGRQETAVCSEYAERAHLSMH